MDQNCQPSPPQDEVPIRHFFSNRMKVRNHSKFYMYTIPVVKVVKMLKVKELK